MDINQNIIEHIENSKKNGIEPQKTIENLQNTLKQLLKDYQAMEDAENEKNERLLYITSLYDEWLQKTEKRGVSYGEIAHIQGLNDGELDEIEKELLKELERLNNEDKTN